MESRVCRSEKSGSWSAIASESKGLRAAPYRAERRRVGESTANIRSLARKLPFDSGSRACDSSCAVARHSACLCSSLCVSLIQSEIHCEESVAEEGCARMARWEEKRASEMMRREGMASVDRRFSGEQRMRARSEMRGTHFHFRTGSQTENCALSDEIDKMYARDDQRESSSIAD